MYRQEVEPLRTMLVQSSPRDDASLDQMVGSKLKELRTEKGWSLMEASQETSVSASALSRIERGELSPTLGSLSKIARGFGVDLTTLLNTSGQEIAKFRRAISREGDGVLQKTGTCTNLFLMDEIRNKKMQPIRTQVTARSPADYREWENYEGEVFVFVLSGTLVLSSELYEDVYLDAFDSTYYDVSLGVKWYSAGKKPADVLWIYAR
ncbi:HTH-type transcriptional regulator SinR [Gluconobacter cerinus]|uniref:HTH-type transcriptional regulator SinR n=2 Tax=Gluconobacter cerinus TaxID=38307 RepID=A0A1B6VIM0_9PROT|nr:HTH-type transcriptional regulator SinR [Gluconobacter cerinus]